jgi:phosphoglycolate phosphatase
MKLFFDLDGTLTDSRPGIISGIQHALRTLGLDVPPDHALLRFIGPPTHDAFREILGTADPELNARAIAIYRERYATTGLFENSVYPGVAEGLTLLAEAGATMFVVTSKPVVFATRIIEHFSLRPYFKQVYGSELSGERSNKGDLISYVLREESLGNEPWMIGDRLHDIRGAKLNSLRSAGVLWGYGSREELSEAGADAIFSSMSELCDAFTG